MATNYPTSIDSFTNPTSGDTLDSPSHAAQHANINDAMVAVQTKLGVGSGTIGTWTSYTTTITQSVNVTFTGNYQYSVVNELCFVNFRLSVTSAGTTNNSVELTLPVAHTFGDNNTLGVGAIFDASTSTQYSGQWIGQSSTVIQFIGDWSAGLRWGTSPNLPLQSGDIIRGELVYRVA